MSAEVNWQYFFECGMATSITYDTGPDTTLGQAIKVAVKAATDNLAGYYKSYEVKLISTEYTPELDCVTYNFHVRGINT